MDLSRINYPERKKTCSESGVEPDRLSELPDSLILHILSFLEMKDVVKTGILSTRWKLLWTHASTIVYRSSSFGIGDGTTPIHELKERVMRPYVPFIDSTLLKCVSSIKLFLLDGYWDIYSENHVLSLLDKWITYVCEKKVEVMELILYWISYSGPDSLYRCSSLTNLNLKHVSIHLSSPVNWTSLKSLQLERICVEDVSMENILLGCPVLETLVLDMVHGLNHLNIMSPSVKNLKLFWIEYADSNMDDLLEIRIPWLREIEISHSFLVRNSLVMDTSCLLKATLTCFPYIHTSEEYDDFEEFEWLDVEKEYNNGWIGTATNLIKAVSQVGELIIGSELIQVLSSSKLRGIPSPSFKCTHLTIESPLWHYDFPGLVYLLQNAPYLETLVVRVSMPQDRLPFSPIEELFSEVEQHLNQVHTNLEHLKNVVIDYHKTQCYSHITLPGKFCDVEVLRYVLSSATALESLVLYLSTPDCCKEDCQYSNCAFEYATRASSSVTNFLARIAAAEWELKKRKFTFDYSFPDYASIRTAY